MKQSLTKSVIFAVLAAALYAVSSPVSKLLLSEIPPTMMAALLYLGAGAGAFAVGIIKKLAGKSGGEQPLTKKELPYTAAMVVLDIAAPIFLMLGLKVSTAATVSLLNNFEIVATAVIALAFFKEAIPKRLWTAIILITAASVMLSFDDIKNFEFSYGALFVLAACVCWGFENNCTRKLSSKNPLEIVVIKGFFSGAGALVVAFIIGERITDFRFVPLALLLGFVAYGLSIMFYIYAQRGLGAARTSAFYAVSPFIGAAMSLVIFRETPKIMFIAAFAFMLLGALLSLKRK